MRTHLHPLKTKSTDHRPASIASPGSAHTAAISGGQKLDTKTQREMSARFGHDFSSVRIHTDTRAEESAETLGANAYTTGRDIVFGQGRYAPGSREGDRLLAHELTHVVQQDRCGGPGTHGQTSERGDASEQEAEAVAGLAASGAHVKVSASPGASIAREEAAGGSDWQNWDDNPLWNFITNDSVSGGVGMAQTHLGDLHNAEAGQSIAQANQMEDEFRIRDYGDRHGWSPNESGTAEEIAGQKNLWKAGSALEEDAGGGAMQVERTLENTASRWSPALKVAQNAGRFLSPLGMYSDGKGMIEDWEKGEHADAVADGLGLVSSTIGTVEAAGAGLTALGATGAGGLLGSAAGFLNPVGAVAGSAAGGYALGKYSLGKANDYAKNHDIFGDGRDSTEAAGDAGMWVQDHVGGTTGKVLGGIAAVGSSWGTAAYSGLHAAGHGIAHGAEWAGGEIADGASAVWDFLSGNDGPSDEEMAANQKQADAVMTENADAMMHSEIEDDLYGPHTSVAHEEMPPLPAAK